MFTTIQLQGNISLQGVINCSPRPVVYVTSNLYLPQGLTVDTSNNLYIADSGNDRIIRFDSTTTNATSVAGISGVVGYAGDGGLATSALLNTPFGLIVDSVRNITYISDTANQVIRKIDSSGYISTFAGTGVASVTGTDPNGDGGLAINATFNIPRNMALDLSGNLYIADYNNHKIRKIDITTGIITTVVGTGNNGFRGDNGLATSATLTNPSDIKFDLTGNLYIADTNNNRIRKVTPSGIITTVVGNGTRILRNNVNALQTGLNAPLGICFDPSYRNMFIANYNSSNVYAVDQSSQIGRIFAGSQGGTNPPLLVALRNPANVIFDSKYNLFISDFSNGFIVKIPFQQPTFNP